MRYCLPGVQLETDLKIISFEPFLTDVPSDLPLVRLTAADQMQCHGKASFTAEHRGIHVAALEDGWLFVRSDREDYALHVSRDYQNMTAFLPNEAGVQELLVPLIRTALECASAAQGVISLHGACVTLEGKAVCFSAPSGTGKSTRAQSWESALGAQFLSGDRPSIRIGAEGATACGIPWDGKEQIFKNTHAPLLAICMLRRGDFTRVRKLSPQQARRLLLRQVFIPMWDTDAAANVMGLVSAISRKVPVYRVICGPGEQDARELKDILYHRQEKILEMEREMKIKSGFVLRNTAGEHVVMPTGKNISRFDGAIVLNDVAAFIWEKMTEHVTREELLEYVLSEFEVTAEQAAKDLDALIEKLRGYDVIEEESV